MVLRRNCRVVPLFVILVAVAATAEAQLITGHDSLIGKLNPFRPFDPSQPVTVAELCKQLDCLSERLRDDGLVVLKQPDVFSQARMTRFRNDFETQMSSDLNTFHLVLAARINRLDAATTTQTTNLSAALAAPGTTNLPPPSTADVTKYFGSTNSFSLGSATGLAAQSAFAPGPGGLGLGPATFNPPVTDPTKAASLSLGVDPTVYLDEKKRFLEHLNEIRRISLGPDQNDSSGYGLYLVRMPVSITPGERTYNGHGADLAVSVEHEFGPDFLPSTFRNLVINDIVDQLGPFLYEVIRSGYYDKVLKARHDAELSKRALMVQATRLLQDFRGSLASGLSETINQDKGRTAAAETQRNGGAPVCMDPFDPIAVPLLRFILRETKPLTGDPDKDRPTFETIADRLDVLADARQALRYNNRELDQELDQGIAKFRLKIAMVRHGLGIDDELRDAIKEYLRIVVRGFLLGAEAALHKVMAIPAKLDPNKIDWSFIEGLYRTALLDDVALLDNVLGLNQDQSAITQRLAQANETRSKLSETQKDLLKLNLSSVRTAKQLYPVAPRELLNIFLEENVYLLARDCLESQKSPNIRSTEIRNYLRHTLQSAYNAMSYQTERASEVPPPLADAELIHRIHEAVRERQYNGKDDGVKSQLEILNEQLVDRLELSRQNVRGRPIAALCWAVAVDAGLLDTALRLDAKKVLETNGMPTDAVDAAPFYFPANVPNDVTRGVFTEYVKTRWPIITFSLDPVTDQQNVADSFNLKRDLQLALSFAFATGQIGFSQLNTFRRQIEQSADTIALNRTVTGFSHGNEIFGYRFTPRFQNPPNQRTNFGVIASQLIGGGPGPDYQIRKSKLEAGIRELTAVLLIPTFLPTMRMNVSTNWFKLNDPEHLVFHTSRMMERGRQVQDLRKAVLDLCNAQEYRGADLRVLQAKLAQLDAMLPMQSKVIQLPFDNIASGFDLFSDGATALVPELTGFAGVDVIRAGTPATAGTPAAAGTPGTAGTPSTAPPAGASVSAPALIQSTNVTLGGVTTAYTVGGAGSIADVFVFGKYISLLDTRVIAGGRSAAFEILSREVIHVQVPSNVIPTVTTDNRQYVEIYLSTPNGMSNSVLVPYDPGTTPPAPTPTAAPVAYKLATTSLDIFYQWLNGADGRPALVASALPGSKSLSITWDSPTGMAPKQLQVQFMATVNNMNIPFSLAAEAGNDGDYSVDAGQFTVTLLNRLQGTITAPAVPQSPITVSLSVQPWLPADASGFRVRTEPKPIAEKLTVNLHFNATGQNALPQVEPVAGPSAARGSRTKDAALVRAAQPPGVLTPPELSEPQPPPLPPPPPSARLLVPPQVPAVATATVASVAATAPPPVPAPGSTSVVVLPAPVTVLSPPAMVEKSHAKSRFHPSRVFNNVGRRMNQMMPQR